MEDRYTVRSDDVTHETFDDELVIVDLQTGSYYSGTGSAVDVWRHLVTGVSPAAIASAIALDADLEEVMTDTSAFIRQLLVEQLIIPASVTSPTIVEVSDTIYRKPVLTKYDDLQALLLVDPIHDVDETGWPALKSTEATL